MPAKAVARRCGLYLSTAYHLLRTLEFEGYLVRTSGGDYALGLEFADRFRELARRLTQRPATEILRSVTRATGHSTYLARFVDGRVTIVAVAEGPRSPHLEDLVVGFDEAAHATALGKALLSTLESTERRAYLGAQGLRRFTQATICDLRGLEAELSTGGPVVEEASTETASDAPASSRTPTPRSRSR